MQLTLFRGALALLYLGPLFAGLAGFGWALVPAFAAIFGMFLFVVRRSLFPGTLRGWSRPGDLVPLLGQMAVQVLLIVVTMAIGRGLGGVVGALPPFSPAWALALSFLSVPLCRWLAIQPDAADAVQNGNSDASAKT